MRRSGIAPKSNWTGSYYPNAGLCQWFNPYLLWVRIFSMEHQHWNTLGVRKYCNFVLGVSNSVFQYDFDQSYDPVSNSIESNWMHSTSQFYFDFDFDFNFNFNFDPGILFHSFFYFNILTDSKSNTLEHSAGRCSCASVCK
jgi:hypothetical protein